MSTTVYYCHPSLTLQTIIPLMLFSYSTVLLHQYIHSLSGLFANNLIGFQFFLP